MAVLLHILLFSILGILQGTSAGYDSKSLESGLVDFDPRCYERLYTVIDNYPKYISYMDDNSEIEDQCIADLQAVIAARNKCECGKEVEDKKCFEEIRTPLENLFRRIRFFGAVYEAPVTQSINNASTEPTYALEDLSCCCKGDVCVKKLEYPVVKYKEQIKECKPEKCNGELYNLMNQVVVYLERLVTLRLLNDQCKKEYEELVKMKGDIPKEGKCKEESASALLHKIEAVNLCYTKYTTLEIVTNGQLNPNILRAITAALMQMIACSKDMLLEKKQ